MIEEDFAELDLFGSFFVGELQPHLAGLACQLRQLHNVPAAAAEVEREGSQFGY